MDPLTQLLLQRQLSPPPAPPPSPPIPLPVVPPSGAQTHTPPEAQRFATAQAMMQGYRDNWTPNPVLTQVAASPK